MLDATLSWVTLSGDPALVPDPRDWDPGIPVPACIRRDREEETDHGPESIESSRVQAGAHDGSTGDRAVALWAL